MYLDCEDYVAIVGGKASICEDLVIAGFQGSDLGGA